MNNPFPPESRFSRAFLASSVLLVTLVWRMLERGDQLISAKVGLAFCFCALACLNVWGIQRAAGQRWSWLAVFLSVCGSAVALVWLAVAIARAVRHS
jgi:hypothetical protein